MPELRRQIDALDADLVARLAIRATYIDRAITLKQEAGLPARIPARVDEVIAKVRDAAQAEDLDPDLAESLWQVLITWSIDREARVIREE